MAFYFPKNSFLTEAVNEKISILKAAGLIDFWISKHMDVKYVKVQEPTKEPTKLNFYQLSGIVCIWGFGCVSAFMVFIVELVWAFLTYKV